MPWWTIKLLLPPRWDGRSWLVLVGWFIVFGCAFESLILTAVVGRAYYNWMLTRSAGLTEPVIECFAIAISVGLFVFSWILVFIFIEYFCFVFDRYRAERGKERIFAFIYDPKGLM